MVGNQSSDSTESTSASADTVNFSWRADVGPGASLETISSILNDLGTLINAGERWALIAARHRAKDWLARQLRSAGPRGLLVAAEELDLEVPHDGEVEWYLNREEGYWFPGEVPPLRWQFENLAEGIVDARLARNMPDPVRVLEVNYRNPLWSIFRASAESVPFVVKVLKVFQNWDSDKRQGKAKAAKAEADASITSADARIRNAQADVSEAVAEVLVKLSKDWKGNLTEPPPFELFQALYREDHAAGQRISKLSYEIEGPSQEGPGGDTGSSDRNEHSGSSQ